MAQSYTPTMGGTIVEKSTTVTVKDQTHLFNQAYHLLHIGFAALPIIAGLDKFFNFLTEWEKYLAPVATQITGFSAPTFMLFVGVVEIIAGIGVAFKPKIFAYVVCAWLCGIIINLLLLGAYYDVALRDLGLAIGAFALARLATIHETKTT